MIEDSVTAAVVQRELEKVQRQIAALERAIDFEPDFGLGEGDPTITRRKVYVLSLDHKRKRISLSLKRLEPYPRNLTDTNYSEGQLVSGIVTGVTDFGAFVALETGVEGLVHVSELADPPQGASGADPKQARHSPPNQSG